ncbi:nucleotidyl transferase AbiEii/AbiGii toxin family protein [Streptomyces olivochromogenes]|uniref:nucleotidyl transferase AbiEii/AbiGii toxin family protein n=1 Tax=Streptomyces olivochromogenes TaxID=1963 RepID=UPI001F1A0F44|nr:nucleotidyl transferase AbiEii/AbiGii toxin family protein [Streptomyces olivochromogenes]MCF3136637.1 nucleotidyl transferase AbiEii/AbiGii toxin family protein [Streptomyces olivochromogenes]
MNLTDLHRRLLADVLDIGTPYPLVITGGYAVQAHGLVNRLSQDLDVATENPTPMDEIARTVADGLTQRGWGIRQVETSPLSGRLIATDRTTGEECEVDILKEAFWSPPTATEHGPVLALNDVIGTKVRALADRGAVRDLIDVHAAARHRTTADLETLGRRHARFEFSLQDLRDRLAGAEWWDDQDFSDYGLSSEQIDDLRAWALAWAGDLDTRISAEEDPDNN